MLSSLHIEEFRGIYLGSIKDLSRLSVLVGPSGCGKSTLLDALLIAASAAPGEAVGRVVHRRSDLWNGARWLFWRGGRVSSPARLTLTYDTGEVRRLWLKLNADASSPDPVRMLLEQRKPGPYSEIITTVKGDRRSYHTAFSVDNSFAFAAPYLPARETPPLPEPPQLPPIRLVETTRQPLGGIHSSLAQVYSEAVEAGRIQEIVKLVRDVVPGLSNILMLADVGGGSVVHLAFEDHSIPVAVAGDGVQALVRLCFEMAGLLQGTLLLEEPEGHQHPKAIYRSARSIVSAVRRGVQIVLATHSLELIDALIAEIKEDELSLLSVYRLGLAEGELALNRYSGPDVAFARGEIGEDLR